MRHDVRAFNSFIVLFLSPAQSLYLPGCLSSVAEPPLVGLTFGLRSGLAPLLRSRRSDVRRLAPSVTFTISDTLTEPTQTCLPEPFTSHSLSRSVARNCASLVSYAFDAIVMLPFFVRRHSYGDYTELSLRSCTNL